MSAGPSQLSLWPLPSHQQRVYKVLKKLPKFGKDEIILNTLFVANLCTKCDSVKSNYIVKVLTLHFMTETFVVLHL